MLLLAFSCTTDPSGGEKEIEDDNNDVMENSEELADEPITQLNQPVTVELEADDFVYFPPDIIVEPGQEVWFIITNIGKNKHSFDIDLPEADLELPNPIEPGATDTLKTRMPYNAGTYSFYCPVENHKSMGMQGTVIVREEE